MTVTFDCSVLPDPSPELDMCNFLTPLECPGTLSYQALDELGNLACFNYSSPEEKATGMLGNDAVLDSGNTAWMLISAAFVMIMTPGVGLFYAGLAGEKTASNTLMMAFGSMCVVTVQWYLFGYSFAFAPGTDGFGSFFWGAWFGIGGNPSGAYGVAIPHTTWVAFQLMFAQLTPALISGAVIGRMKFTSYLILIAIWTTVVYDPLAHWVWSFAVNDEGVAGALGWMGVKEILDFAGGSVIHISSGFAALACALVLGKRQGFGEEVKPHNLPLVIIGAALLWIGWFGFNAGSAGGATPLASVAFLNTHFAAAAGCFSWMLTEKIFAKKVTPSGAAAGIVAGLVAITPAAGFVDVWTSLIFGIVVSPFCYGAAKLKTKLGVDDTLDCFALHGVGGVIGGFMTGLFATKNINFKDGAFYGNAETLGWQMVGIVVSAVFSFVLTLIIMLILKFTIGVRVDEDIEKEGIDVSEHGGKSYQH